MAKLHLWVICKHCGRSFDTGRRMDRRSFERGTLAANYHTCPHCAMRQTYRKADYELRLPGEEPTRQSRPPEGTGPG